MPSLTAAESLFLQEHLRSSGASISFLQFAAQICSDPRCKSLCENMARDHQSQLQGLNRFLGLS